MSRSIERNFPSTAIRLLAAQIWASACLSGCAMPGKPLVEPAAAATKQPESAGETKASPEPEPDAKTLAAIEDFLTRTQQYRQPLPLVGASTPTPARTPITDEPAAARPSAAAPPVSPDSAKAAAPKQAAANMELSTSDAPPPQPALPIPAVERVTIEWSEEKREEASPSQPNSANTPMVATTGQGEPATASVLEDLEADAESRRDFESHWRLKHAQLAMGRDNEAKEAVTQLPVETGSLLSALAHASLAVRASAADPLEHTAQALAKIDDLRRLVAQNADPTVSHIALCRKVLTFGSYEELPQEELVSGRTIPLIVYSEVGNFRSRQTDEAAYETQLATRLEVFTKGGELVWQRDEPEVMDTCRNLRRDFFIAQRVTLPPTLPAGDYVLKVRVEDKLAAKAGEAVKPFSIHSPVSVAKKP